MIDNVLLEIMSNKPNEVYQAWLKDRTDTKKFKDEKERLDNKNLNISHMIDRLNLKIKG